MKYVLLGLFILTLGSCGPAIYMANYGTDTKVYDARLIDAYSSMQKCGHKGRYQCEEFRGRFIFDSGPIKGWSIDQNIDGFLYNRFIEKNKQTIHMQISAMNNTVEGENKWTFWLGLVGIVAFSFFFAIGFGCLLESEFKRD